MEIQFRDLMIQPLPTPTADNPTQPGFHLRTVKTDQGDRKYTVYVPEGYDGTKAFPVVLFLHGAGERGDDGITPAQVGLGPAILNRPGGIPAIVVFPQARRTWSADSADSHAALKALDEVLGAYKTEPNRVILTGLSMGGHGSWDIATAHARPVRRRGPDLRARRTRGRRPAQGAAGLDVLRRRRPRRDRAQPPRDGRSPPARGQPRLASPNIAASATIAGTGPTIIPS